MERILVAMDTARTHFFAGIHALSLAKRINAKVLFLLVFPVQDTPSTRPAKTNNEVAVKKRVEALIEEARSEGVAVDYYLAYGNYENELVSFVQENKITLLVVESPIESGEAAEAAKGLLDKIRHRINCRIEVVNEKPEISQRKE